jgi:hypothetical protein
MSSLTFHLEEGINGGGKKFTDLARFARDPPGIAAQRKDLNHNNLIHTKKI